SNVRTFRSKERRPLLYMSAESHMERSHDAGRRGPHVRNAVGVKVDARRALNAPPRLHLAHSLRGDPGHFLKRRRLQSHDAGLNRSLFDSSGGRLGVAERADRFRKTVLLAPITRGLVFVDQLRVALGALGFIETVFDAPVLLCMGRGGCGGLLGVTNRAHGLSMPMSGAPIAGGLEGLDKLRVTLGTLGFGNLVPRTPIS